METVVSAVLEEEDMSAGDDNNDDDDSDVEHHNKEAFNAYILCSYLNWSQLTICHSK